MLTAKLTERAGGFALAGDLLDLRGLHETLHELCADDCDDDAYPENLVFQLAYDVRKAFEGRRDKTRVESFGARPVTYHSVTLSLVRASIQFGFLVKLVSGKAISMKDTAAIHAFGAAVATALEPLEIGSPEKYLGAVAQSVRTWSDWPPAFVVDSLDRDFLYAARTKPARVKRLKQLPTNLTHGSTFATRALRSRDKFAAEEGVPPDAVRVAWPEEFPLY